jgi:chemotaxis protein CheX
MSVTVTNQPSAFPEVVADAVRESIASSLGTILGTAPVEGESDPELRSLSRVLGVISMVGEGSWTVAFTFPEPTAVTLVQQFCGFEIEFAAPEMGDAVGELVNVVAGELVAQLEARQIKAQMSLPMVARGKNVEVMMPAGLPSIDLNYLSEQGAFWVKLIAARPGQSLGRRPGS